MDLMRCLTFRVEGGEESVSDILVDEGLAMVSTRCMNLAVKA